MLKPWARSSAPKLADPATSWRVRASKTARSQSPLLAFSVAVTNPRPAAFALLRTTPCPGGSGRLMQFWGWAFAAVALEVSRVAAWACEAPAAIAATATAVPAIQR
jgi:hypothetical protein